MIYEKNRFISDSCLELYFQLHLIENNSFQKIDENFSWIDLNIELIYQCHWIKDPIFFELYWIKDPIFFELYWVCNKNKTSVVVS